VSGTLEVREMRGKKRGGGKLEREIYNEKGKERTSKDVAGESREVAAVPSPSAPNLLNPAAAEGIREEGGKKRRSFLQVHFITLSFLSTPSKIRRKEKEKEKGKGERKEKVFF